MPTIREFVSKFPLWQEASDGSRLILEHLLACIENEFSVPRPAPGVNGDALTYTESSNFVSLRNVGKRIAAVHLYVLLKNADIRRTGCELEFVDGAYGSYTVVRDTDISSTQQWLLAVRATFDSRVPPAS